MRYWPGIPTSDPAAGGNSRFKTGNGLGAFHVELLEPAVGPGDSHVGVSMMPLGCTGGVLYSSLAFAQVLVDGFPAGVIEPGLEGYWYTGAGAVEWFGRPFEHEGLLRPGRRRTVFVKPTHPLIVPS